MQYKINKSIGLFYVLALILICSLCTKNKEINNKDLTFLKGKPVALKIGLIPEQNILKQMERYAPLGEYIKDISNIKISFTILSRYGNIIDNFQNLKLDGAFWGSFTGALAIKTLGITHIVRPVNLDGTSTYRGYIFVRKDSNIRNVRDMKNKSMVFVDKATTAGYIFPLAYFRENGILNFRKFIREFYFSGSHDAAVHDVLSRKADIGVAKNTIFDLLANREQEVKENLLILSSSEAVPSNGLGLRKDLDPEITERFKQVLLSMDQTERGREVLKNFLAVKFIENSENDFLPVFKMAQKAGLNLKKYDYSND